MKIFERVKEICNEQNRSVAEVERASGLSNGAISKWDDSVPSIKNIMAVANSLSVSIEDLIGDET